MIVERCERTEILQPLPMPPMLIFVAVAPAAPTDAVADISIAIVVVAPMSRPEWSILGRESLGSFVAKEMKNDLRTRLMRTTREIGRDVRVDNDTQVQKS